MSLHTLGLKVHEGKKTTVLFHPRMYNSKTRHCVWSGIISDSVDVL